MANFPMIPMTLDMDNACVIICNGGRLIIGREGEVKVEGSIKDAALGLVKHVIQAEFNDGVISMDLNRTVRIERDLDGHFYIEYIKQNKPAFWDELEKEFYRLAKMKAFW